MFVLRSDEPCLQKMRPNRPFDEGIGNHLEEDPARLVKPTTSSELGIS
jgi:hypothetical protein